MIATDMIRTCELTQVYLDGSDVWALDGLDLRVPLGAFLALLGPSGAGKSTLLRILAGREKPAGGQVWVDGQYLGALGKEELAHYWRRGVGYLPHHPALLEGLTVLQNVALPLLPCRHPGELEARAAGLLEVVGLGERLGQRAEGLSAGERERVGLARALIAQPPLLLLDEPSASLEGRWGGAVLGLLDRLNREEGLTILLATREVQKAGLAGRVLRLEEGRLQEEGERAWVELRPGAQAPPAAPAPRRGPGCRTPR
jgi:ABC-type methionine transport system ATPase subunit